MNQTTLKSYIYRPLRSPRDIRLITLLRGSAGDQISITINHVSLERKPKYEALSYVWGSQIPSYPIQCDGSEIFVGANLRDVLLRLRNVDEDRTLWIDRIAINQQDLDERALQVGLMADIYAFASAVIVWLGAADGYTQIAIDLINDLSGRILEYWRTQRPESYDQARTSFHTVRYPPPEDPSWLAVRSLFQRPWFLRVWTFQEIVLAKKAVCHCGPYSISWTRLETFIAGLQVYSEGPNIADTRLRGAEKHFMTILKARRLYLQKNSFTPHEHYISGGMFALLDNLRTRQATDPRDKVFALLNVAYDTKDSHLIADYHKTHAEVYAQTAKWLLRTQQRLAFLSLVEKKDKPDLISWVPDFRYKDEMNFLHSPTQIYRGNNHIYQASGRTKAFIKENESDFQLTVRGIYVGTIIDRTDPPGNITNNVAIGPKVLDGGQWHAFVRTCAEDGLYPQTGEPIDLAYHRTRIWDILPGEGLDRHKRTSAPLQIPQPGPISYNYANDAMLHGAKDDIATSIIRFTTRKRLFKTESSLIGIGHRSLEVGDKIYVLMGADMPVILKPLGGNYFGFGGESYVHGVMDGEMLDKAVTKQSEPRARSASDFIWTSSLGDRNLTFITEELVLV